MFSCVSRVSQETVTPRVQADGMAELFAIIGVVIISLLGVARWWEER